MQALDRICCYWRFEVFEFEEQLNVNLCQKNPDALIVYGDNLLGKGKAGQAIIRDEYNAFGVPTKRLPSVKDGSFFNDKQDEYDLVKDKLVYLWEQHEEGKSIILPSNMIGTGLANLSKHSPNVMKLIERFYKSAKETLK
jgi:hypothetical protein